jgi:YD repeat-containing protein
MKAYKASYNGTCLTLKYEVGRTYTFNGKIKMCDQGFHFCRNPKDILRWYDYGEDFVLFEIDVMGKVVDKPYKSLTNKFKILRVVNPEEYPELLGIEIDENYRLTRNGRNYMYKYNSNGQPTKEIQGDYIWVHEYDDNGHKLTSTLSCYDKVYKTVYEYDDRWNITKRIDDGEIICEWEYDKDNNLIKGGGKKGGYSYYEYDERGLKTKEIRPGGSISEWKYDANGKALEQIDDSEPRFANTYDELGNRIKRIDFKHDTVSFDKYDSILSEKHETDGWSITREHYKSGKLISHYESKYNGQGSFIGRKDLLNGDEWSITIE